MNKINKNIGGKFFVIDGVDGSGKGTQTKILAKKLEEEGFNVLIADFPQYGNKSAALVEEYLNGKFGSAKEVTPYQASIFYACDRFAASKKLKEHLNQGGVIISNRYVSSNQIHQAGKIEDGKELDKFLDWLDELEFDIFKIPKPDKVFFLNVPFEIGRELVLKKSQEERSYIDSNSDKKRDLHEEDEDHLKDAYNRACFLSKKFDYWEEIKCYDGKNLRDIEDIHEELYKKILN